MYLVFGGQSYYATGGGFDLLGTFEEGAKAWDFAASVIGKRTEWDDEVFPDDPTSSPIEWSHILDLKSGKVTAEFGDSPHGLGRAADRVVDE
ncbi:hypothetical protein O4H29_06745 [Marinobacter salarius]|uniref:hypothetical protein n=1 Tax=Marinobacter salarius TaxID=1420917 RepID=UPI0022B1304D|nr:hypothetical protein [Marinobacter salarius]MCZ4284530.1 hypothetical protein [Marinobacter salarius]